MSEVSLRPSSTIVQDTASTTLWNAVHNRPDVGLFSSRPWTEAIASTYGFTISSVARGNDGEVDAAVLYSHVADVRGERIVSLPFCDYCDPFVDDPATWQDLVAPLLARRIPVYLRCLRSPFPAADRRFQTAGRAAWHGIDLTRTEKDMWECLRGSARTDVRKARRLDVRVRQSTGLNDVRTFHAMHCSVRKSTYRMLAQPFALFEQLHATYAPDNQLTVLMAEINGAPVAGAFLIEWKDTLYYKFAASLDRSAAPNDLLMWETMRFGQSRGLKLLDLGASDIDQPGLLRFKRKYATDEQEILRLRWQPQGYTDPRAEQAGKLLSRVTQLLTDPSVPDDITRAGGDALYGQFC